MKQNKNMIELNLKAQKCHLPLPFFKSFDGPKIFDAILLRTERGVDGKLPPKMSLLPPPGGLRTLKKYEKRMEKN